MVFVLFILYYNCLYVLSSVLWCPLPFPHKNVSTIWVTWRVLCKRVDLLSIGNRPIFGGSVLIIFLVCVCVLFGFFFLGGGWGGCLVCPLLHSLWNVHSWLSLRISLPSIHHCYPLSNVQLFVSNRSTIMSYHVIRQQI